MRAAPAQSDRSRLLDFPDRLAIESGRPVIVVPRAHRGAPEERCIAWNQSGEAARAFLDALPLLKGARKVIELLTIRDGNDRTDEHEDALPQTAVADALARHAVKPIITTLNPSRFPRRVSRFCSHTIVQEADLLVMGAYGHARLREFVFGGATRHVFAHMPIPVLLSHSQNFARSFRRRSLNAPPHPRALLQSWDRSRCKGSLHL